MKVVVALITDASHRFLLTRRAWSASHGGLWEFPGGKIESDEAPELALKREIHEELGIECLTTCYLGEFEHQYPQKKVHFFLYRVLSFNGVPRCLETQLDMHWVHESELQNYHFPEANYKMIDIIKKTKAVSLKNDEQDASS